jgi:hypothetical protein
VGVVLWQAHDLEAVVISGVNLTVGLSSECMPPPRNIKLNIQYSTDLQKCSCLKRDFMYVVLFIFSNFNCEKQVNASALLF